MIIYFGDDQHFFDRMKSFYSSNSLMSHVQPVHSQFIKDNIIRLFTTKRPYSIILDFSKKVEHFNELFMSLNYLKKCQLYKGIPIIGLFKSKKELEKLSHLFSYGLNYPFIKGCDENILFLDINYLSFETETLFSKFAKANLNKLPYEGKQIAHIYGFTNETILIESDNVLKVDELVKLTFKIVDENRTFDLRCKNTYSLGVSASFLNRYEFEIPFLGPWDDPGSDLIHKDSFETWVEESCDIFTKKSGRVLIVSSRSEDFLIASKLFLETNFDLYLCSSFEEAKNYVQSYIFDLIFYRLGKPEDEFGEKELNFENLYRLTNALKNLQNLDSILVAFNSPSRTDALRKAIEYENILGVAEELGEDKIIPMMQVFQKKGKKLACQTFCYKPLIQQGNSTFHIDMKMSSITEHELTFYSQSEIPMYSIMKIEVPCELYLLVVPPIYPLERGINNNHYMGFILGGEESDAELIRSFVNRAVVKGLTSFSLLPEDLLLETEEDATINNSLKENEASNPKTTHNKCARVEVIRKTNPKGKSKL